MVPQRSEGGQIRADFGLFDSLRCAVSVELGYSSTHSNDDDLYVADPKPKRSRAVTSSQKVAAAKSERKGKEVSVKGKGKKAAGKGRGKEGERSW
jgi:hypothetical protein